MQEITSDPSGVWIFVLSTLIGVSAICGLVLRAVAAA